MEKYEGDIEVNSQPGYTTFSVFLPILTSILTSALEKNEPPSDPLR